VEIGDANDGSAEIKSPCERTRAFPVSFSDPTSIQPGDPAAIRLGAPPSILVNGLEVGQVQEPDANIAEGCLLEGFRLSGSVESIDPSSGTGTILVSGAKA
jgi:hypothetical protein